MNKYTNTLDRLDGLLEKFQFDGGQNNDSEVYRILLECRNRLNEVQHRPTMSEHVVDVHMEIMATSKWCDVEPDCKNCGHKKACSLAKELLNEVKKLEKENER